MKLNLQHFGWGVVLLALTTTTLVAADRPTASAEIARQAISTLQSGAPAEEKALACKRLAIYGPGDAVPALASFLADEQLASWSRIASNCE